MTSLPKTRFRYRELPKLESISGEESDYLTQASEKGIFEAEVDLISGVNQIKVTAIDGKGGQSLTKVLVVYSSAFEPKTFLPSEPAEASGENAIRDKVAQKVAEALSKPKAFIGTVTDIADSTIQIKSTESQIEQISLSEEEIDVVNATGKTNKTVKLTDIAIGDFIVAMGYVNTNSVLSAQRILITSPVEEPSLNAYMAEVTATTAKGLTVSRIPEATSETITPNKNTDIYDFTGGKTTTLKLASISEGDIVLYVLNSSATTPSLRSVFRIAESQD